MSETTEQTQNSGQLKLNTLFAFKMGMTSYVTGAGTLEAATILKFEPWVVSAIQTAEKNGYVAVKLACRPKRSKRTTKAEQNSLKSAGFENGAYFQREVRQTLPGDISVGQKVDIASLAAGDKVKVSATSKGKGFEGVVKRWGMAGGPQTHGSGFHRRPGSSGNRTWPGRVMPGKKFPGQLGNATVTSRSQIVEINTEENVIVMRGSIPGAINSLVKLTKV
ncbi:MAG: 50S ribosomal protein L3 [Bdellovibrionota bacterium]